MGCSRPNIIGVDSRYRGSRFLGPRHQEKSIRDFEQDQYYTVTDIPCGKCETCLLDRRYSKALRIMLEAESWPQKTSFITLTYANENLVHPDLNHKDWAQFVKDFRQEFCQAKYCDISVPRHYKRYGKVRSTTFKTIKQVMCGEYGDTFGRKHFHGIIFNHTFDDVYFTGIYSKKGNPVHSSQKLQAVWKKGHVQVEEMTFDLALYVGSYLTDDYNEEGINDGHQKKQYGRFGIGIGESWIRKYWRDALSAGCIKTLERDYPIPRYFLDKIKLWYPEKFEQWKREKHLKYVQRRAESIKKGDGPLRRAKAEGRIFHSNRIKRKKDESIRN